MAAQRDDGTGRSQRPRRKESIRLQKQNPSRGKPQFPVRKTPIGKARYQSGKPRLQPSRENPSRVSRTRESAATPLSQGDAWARQNAPGAQPVGFGEPSSVDSGRHSRASLMTYVANVIDDNLYELDQVRVSARRRLRAVLSDGEH